MCVNESGRESMLCVHIIALQLLKAVYQTQTRKPIIGILSEAPGELLPNPDGDFSDVCCGRVHDLINFVSANDAFKGSFWGKPRGRTDVSPSSTLMERQFMCHWSCAVGI